MLTGAFQPGNSAFRCAHQLGYGILGKSSASTSLQQLVSYLVFEFKHIVRIGKSIARANISSVSSGSSTYSSSRILCFATLVRFDPKDRRDALLLSLICLPHTEYVRNSWPGHP